jgi:predicted PurR-regulated permease PerM
MPSAQRVHNTLFTLAIVALAAWIAQPFFVSLLWAVIMSVASWPLYCRIRTHAGNRRTAAALLCTMLLTALFLLPALWALGEAARQAPALAHLLNDASQRGIGAPPVLARIPFAGPYLHNWWMATLAQPHGLAHLLSGGQPGRLLLAGEAARQLGGRLLHRLIDFGFALLSLFFLYRDGPSLYQQFNVITQRWLGAARWHRYAGSIPHSIRATVNGLVLVGMGEGVLIGIAYLIAGLPSAATWGALSAVLAVIPFGAPLAFLSAAALLFVSGHVAGAIGVAAWGMVVVFVADHVVRPRLIGDATRMPFLAVLFGILGGLEAMGLIGLFIGPVVMMLFVTLWREPQGMSGGGQLPGDGEPARRDAA